MNCLILFNLFAKYQLHTSIEEKVRNRKVKVYFWRILEPLERTDLNCHISKFTPTICFKVLVHDTKAYRVIAHLKVLGLEFYGRRNLFWKTWYFTSISPTLVCHFSERVCFGLLLFEGTIHGLTLQTYISKFMS